MTDTKQPIKRILGDLRIFQAVVNDLKMKHELVELADGTHRYVYTYDGVDPYEMEDSEFPLTVKLIVQHTNSVLEEVLNQLNMPNPYETSTGETVPSFEAPAHAYKVAIQDVKHIVEGIRDGRS